MEIMRYTSLLSCNEIGFESPSFGGVGEAGCTIFRLAFGCPQTDGKVVFAARNLFRSLTNLYFNFPNTCSNDYANNLSKIKVVKAQAINDKILIYPNPTNGIVNIQLPQQGNWEISLFDITGKVLWNQECKGCNTTIKHVLNGAKGLYFIKIIDKLSGQQTLKKITLQ